MATDQWKTPATLRAGQTLPAHRVESILTELRTLAGAGQPTATLYVPASVATDAAAIVALARDPNGRAWIDALERMAGNALRSATGVAAFRSGDAGLAVIPPFPLDIAWMGGGVMDDPLQSLLSAQFTVGVALVRLGRYAVAIYQGRRLAVSKTDTRYVKGKHHAGGTSQRRFQRVRENQIHRLYAEASEALERQWQPWLDRLDFVALGGEAATVRGFARECRLLSRLAPITLPHRLDVREPNRAALDRVGDLLYQCRVYPLRWYS